MNYMIRFVKDDGKIGETKLFSVSVSLDSGCLCAKDSDGQIVFAAAPNAWLGIWALNEKNEPIPFQKTQNDQQGQQSVQEVKVVQKVPEKLEATNGEMEWVQLPEEQQPEHEEHEDHHDANFDNHSSENEGDDIDQQDSDTKEIPPEISEDPAAPKPLEVPEKDNFQGWLAMKAERIAEIINEEGVMDLADIALELNISIEHADMSMVRALMDKKISPALISRPGIMVFLSKNLPRLIAAHKLSRVFQTWQLFQTLGEEYADIEMNQIQAWLSMHNLDGSPK